MNNKWIKKGDKVLVISGNDKGKTGEVLSRKEDKVVVQGVNIRKKHAKRKSQTARSEILELEMPFHITNVCLCTAEGVPIRLQVKQTKKGGKELIYTLDDKEISHRQVKK